jgi:CTP-dependent riboflavin kinase
LNLKLERPFVQPETDTIEIRGFQEGSRTYGRCRCYPCWIEGIGCAIIRPDRSSHNLDTIEIIAPVSLRISLDLHDGDEVEIILKTNPTSKDPNGSSRNQSDRA